MGLQESLDAIQAAFVNEISSLNTTLATKLAAIGNGSGGGASTSSLKNIIQNLSQGQSATIAVPIESVVNVTETSQGSINIIPPVPIGTYTSSLGSVIYSTQYDSSEGNNAWTAFNGAVPNNGMDTWCTAVGDVVGAYLGFNFNSPQIVTKYLMCGRNEIGDLNPQQFKSWIFESSNNGVDYTVLDTQINNNALLNGSYQLFFISNNIAYKYYRVRCLANNGSNLVALAQLQMFKDGNNFATIGSLNQSTTDISISKVDATHVSIKKNTATNGSTSSVQINYLG